MGERFLIQCPTEDCVGELAFDSSFKPDQCFECNTIWELVFEMRKVEPIGDNGT